MLGSEVMDCFIDASVCVGGGGVMGVRGGVVGGGGGGGGTVSELRSCVTESRSSRPELPVPNSPYGLRGRKAILNQSSGAV